VLDTIQETLARGGEITFTVSGSSPWRIEAPAGREPADRREDASIGGPVPGDPDEDY
jgi:hypothetical protein